MPPMSYSFPRSSRMIPPMYGYSRSAMSGVIHDWRCLVEKTTWRSICSRFRAWDLLRPSGAIRVNRDPRIHGFRSSGLRPLVAPPVATFLRPFGAELRLIPRPFGAELVFSKIVHEFRTGRLRPPCAPPVAALRRPLRGDNHLTHRPTYPRRLPPGLRGGTGLGFPDARPRFRRGRGRVRG